MSKLLKIALQEFRMTAVNRAFVILTLAGPFLLAAFTVLPTLLAQRESGIPEGSTIAVSGLKEEHWRAFKAAAVPSGIELLRTAGSTLPDLKEAIEKGEIDGLLVFPEGYLDEQSFPYYTGSGTDIMLVQTLEEMTSRIVTAARMVREGLDPDLIQSLSEKPSLRVLKTTAEEGEAGQDFMTIMLTCIAFMMLIYMTILLYGQMIGRSVIREKSSKTVEIILSSVRPGDMMFGKLIGIGTAGILQYGFWIALTLGLSGFILPALGIDAAGTGITASNMAYLILYFILAYFLYAACYAAIGSAAEDEQHMGQLGMPLLLFLIVPMIMITYIVTNPGSPPVVALSLFPLTSPLVMLMRILISAPPAGEIALSVALIAGSTVLTVIAAGRIFRTGILMTGKRNSLGEILKWAGK